MRYVIIAGLLLTSNAFGRGFGAAKNAYTTTRQVHGRSSAQRHRARRQLNLEIGKSQTVRR